MWNVALLALAVLAGWAASAAAQDAKKDQEKLQGTWTVVSCERDGAADDNIKNDKLVIAGDKITIKKGNGGEEEPVTFTMDASKKPMQLDISAKGKTILAVFEVNGDDLKLCFGQPGTERPADFTAKAGSNRMFVTLKRDK
jgi:uncharacterized protein (TIGR03067 family)